MSLGRKILSVSVAITLLCLVVTWAAFRIFVVPGFARVEAEQARNKILRCVDALENDLAQLDKICRDYAVWDDMYAFVRSGDPGFVANSLHDSALQNLGLDLVHVADETGRTVFVRSIRRATLAPRPLAALWAGDAGRLPEPLAAHGSEVPLRGFLHTPAGLLMVSQIPISDSAGKQIPRGSLTFGRFLDDAEIASLRKLVRHDFEVVPSPWRGPGAAPVDGRGRPPADPQVSAIGDERIETAAQLQGLAGDTVAEVRLTLPREIFAQGLGAVRSALVAIGIAMAAVLLVFMALVERHVTRSLRAMTGTLQDITSGKDTAALLPAGQSDEIGVLAREFNSLLVTNRAMTTDLERRVEERTSALREANRGLSLAGIVFENIPDAVLITDAGGTILNVNPSFTAVTGYAPEEVVGRKPAVIKSHRHGRDFYAAMWRDLMAIGAWSGEVWNRRKSGEVYPALLAISSLRDEQGRITHYIGTQQDISHAKASEDRIRYLAYHDVLTGLPNRMLIKDRLELAVLHGRRDGSKVVLVFLDLDGFKKVNDTLGHAVGDLLLVDVAGRLRDHTRGEDTVARLGGDEFLVLFSRVRDEQAVLLVVEKLLEALAAPYRVSGHEIVASASMGISVFPNDGDSFEALLMGADIAMYRAKESGKKGYQVFSQEMTDRIRRHVDIENRLRRALEQGGLTVHFQPRYDIATRAIRGAEALVRWPQEGGGFLPPAEFIPIAEECGLIVPLGDFVLAEACRRANEWQRRGAPGLRLSVNVSPRQLLERDFASKVRAVLAATGLDPASLEIEITENIFVSNVEATSLILNELSQVGVRFALDDFGTGYSSLYYLKQLPIKVLKIDRSFVHDLEENADSRVIIDTILSMAEVLKVDVVAEGLETEFQERYIRDRFRGAGAEGQGFLFSRPLPPEEFARLLFHG